MSSKSAQTSLWPLTAWNEVEAAGRAAGKELKPIDELFRKYETPLRVHLRQRFRTFPLILENAEDLLQEFAAAKILKEGWLGKSDPRKGRFRDFLRTSLDNLVWSWWKKQPEYKAWLQQKQRGAAPRSADSQTTSALTVPLPEDQPAPEPPSEEFNLAWVQTVLADTLQRMEQDCKKPRDDSLARERIWEVFRAKILEPIFNEVEPIPYEQLVKRFGLRSPAEASNMLLSAKRIFRRHLKSVIAEYEQHGSEREELEELKQILSRLTRGKARPVGREAG